jgi:aspartate aminotransferase-like enzyme
MNTPIGPAAFVFKNRKTGQFVVSSGDVFDYWDKKQWEHTASINACLAIQYLINVKPKERNRYIRSLTEKI